MKSTKFISYTFILALLFSTFSAAQNTFTELKGTIVDANNNAPLVFADLVIDGTNISTISNTEGEFVLKIPDHLLSKEVTISYLGYKTQSLTVNALKAAPKIKLQSAFTQLESVNISRPKDAESLVRATLKLKGENYFTDNTVMTAFYRETIKKRRKNASLSEAVVKIHKQPYTSGKKDVVSLVKARKNTNYSRLDTVALKLQGGPFSTLYTDMIKYPQFIFDNKSLSEYDFTFDTSTQVNNKLVYVVNFKQKPSVTYPLYHGKLFIDAESKALTSAIYSLNVSNQELASKMFVRRKPRQVKVYPTEANYRVNYRVHNGKWYYGYSNTLLAFKVKWKGKLFNSKYTLNSEMAVTDWAINTPSFERSTLIKPTTILIDQASGFSDPEFWGQYNIIEPEKSIESAIKKISKQLKRKV